MSLPLALLVCSVVAASTGSARAEDWPQFGGPARTGVSSETGWTSKGGAEPVWQANVGLGYSACAVRGNRLYTLGHDKEGKVDVVFCLDANTGEEVWAQAFPAELRDLYHGGGTLTTPTLDGERLFVSEREGQLFCFAAKDGEILWSKTPAKDLGIALPTWGFSASPLVLGERVILNLGVVCAFAKADGASVWKTEKNYGHAYSTPAAFALKGKPCLAVFCGEGLAILAQEDGRELAFTAWKTTSDVNAMTPIVLEDDKVFISSGNQRGCALVGLAAEKAEMLWESKVMCNSMNGSVLWQEHLYGFDDQILKCIDLEGNERWRARGIGLGALMIADGRLIVISDQGELVIAEASPEGFSELSRAKVLEGGPFWTMPVLAGGRIYCRNQGGDLVCLDHRAE